MDLALASTPALPPCDIKRINYCRLYLNVVTFSDMVNAAGTHLDAGIYQGSPTIRSHPQSKLLSVNQQRPGNKAWLTWQKFLRKFIVNKRYKKLIPEYRQRHWTVPPEELRLQWKQVLACPTL